MACQEIGVFLWLSDPARIKNSMGLARGKNDTVDAARIAEYSRRYEDRAVRHAIPDAALVSMKSLLSDREFLLAGRKRYQSQLSDQKRYMAPDYYKRKSRQWKKVIMAIDRQILAIDEEIGSLIGADDTLRHHRGLLKSVDGIGDRIAVNMIAIMCGFTRFSNTRLLCSFAGITPYRYDSGSSVRSKAKTSKRAIQTMKTAAHERDECRHADEGGGI